MIITLNSHPQQSHPSVMPTPIKHQSHSYVMLTPIKHSVVLTKYIILRIHSEDRQVQITFA